MFKFEPIERCLFNGVSSAMIADGSVRNEFLMRFGEKSLDDRVSVVLTDRNIQFFYYDAQGEYDILKDARDSDHLKEIGSISLTSPKETGNDILCFPQNGFLPKKYKEEKKENGIEKVFGEQPLDSLLNVIGEEEKGFCKMFSHFPFIKTFVKTKTKKRIEELIAIENGEEKARRIKDFYEKIFRDFAKCCLLAFVFEIEDREENFANSPLYDEVRTTLRKSDVYNLLSAKIRYTLYISDKGINYNREEYSYKTRKFADRLMDKNINKVIAPYNYPSGKGQPSKGQSWFYNPEEELEEILKKNRDQFSGESSESTSGELVLEPQLEMKIQNFLYTKHAVYSAMTRNGGKAFFVVGQILMSITWICIAWACLQPSKYSFILDNVLPIVSKTAIVGGCVVLICEIINISRKYGWRNWPQFWLLLFFVILAIVSYLKIPTGIYLVILTFIILGFILFSGFFNNPLSDLHSNFLQPLFPRILVAIFAAWLGIGIAEDAVKSMLWVDNNMLKFAIGAVMLLIIVILMGEIKQHSPYYRWFSRKWFVNWVKLSKEAIVTIRAMLILNHSIFFALLGGILMQLVFYNDLVKTSEVLPNVVYNKYFDDANYYCQNLETLNESLKQFELLYLTSKNVGSISIKGSMTDSTSKSTAGFQATSFYRDTLRIEDYNRYVEIVNISINEIISLCKDTTNKSINVEPFLAKNDSLNYTLDSLNIADYHMGLKRTEDNDVISGNFEMIYSDMLSVQKEIAKVKRAISLSNNYDTLINWATVNQENSVNTGSAYLDELTKKAQKDYKCSLTIPVCDKNKPAIFFPILLIFHTLIVLVLAFVTQLLISDKSVTEPL